MCAKSMGTSDNTSLVVPVVLCGNSLLQTTGVLGVGGGGGVMPSSANAKTSVFEVQACMVVPHCGWSLQHGSRRTHLALVCLYGCAAQGICWAVQSNGGHSICLVNLQL